MDCPVGGDPAVQAHDSCVEGGTAAAPEIVNLELDAEWRREVATRLERYRARRKPRAPRYPSLRLPFDSADHWAPVNASSLAVSAAVPAPSAVIGPEAVAENEQRREQESARIVEARPRIVEEPEFFTNVIEFPRWAAIPASPGNELAEPIFDRPRIVEAPEVLPPPPALGGMLMEAATSREPEGRANSDLLASASLPRRILAGLLDGLVLGSALAAFTAIFLWLNPLLPPRPVIAAGVIIVGVLLWAAYEFLFVVYTGSTPGLRLARLRLTRFDGSPTNRRVRRWRVLASYLSAFSLGLGYLWSVLDEDSLCWHDRMTRTHFS
jgi:uncharacterized RDD family membrane protein YckC